ncbi:MAG: DNA polymerase IV [Candidatus Heimdallarchaeota archaeon LC_2]|nr:MAG: DNA polymerase IV [Candidatus Heimdallarchaeota archaeon LC_2]
MELTEVKGIGPATAIKLKSAGISTAEDLAKASIDEIVSAGIRKPTATKIAQNAKDVVGTSSDKKVEEKPKKAPKTTSKKPEAKKAKREIRAVKIPISYVKGVGPKTRNILENAEINFAKDLASTKVEKLVEIGISKATALKILANAQEQVGTLPSDKKEEKIHKVEKKEVEVVTKDIVEEKTPAAKPKKEKKKPAKDVAEHERSPIPQGIPTKKKRGVQVRKVDEIEEDTELVEKPAGWGVQAKELTKEEIELRKARQEEIARSRQITRQIPVKPSPVKAIKPKKLPPKGGKPEKQVKDKKVGKRAKKKTKVVIEYYSQEDLYSQTLISRKRGITGKEGTKKPRISLERDTKLGRISSHRRSRRVIHETQVILKLENGFNPDQIVGKKVYFIYPETTTKVPGSISKRFGKASSGKVLVYFKKGIRVNAINQPIFIK